MLGLVMDGRMNSIQGLEGMEKSASQMVYRSQSRSTLRGCTAQAIAWNMLKQYIVLDQHLPTRSQYSERESPWRVHLRELYSSWCNMLTAGSLLVFLDH